MVIMNYVKKTPPGEHTRFAKAPLEDRYFIFRNVNVTQFLKLVAQNHIGPKDTVYLSPDKPGMDRFRNAAPELKVYDLGAYEEKTLLSQLRGLGFPVIIAGK